MKKEVKESESRIIVYLSMVHPTRKNVVTMAAKLNIDYSYMMRVLSAMVAKGWLLKRQRGRFMYYDLSRDAPLESAVKALGSDDLQSSLQEYTKEAPNAPKTKEQDGGLPDALQDL